MDTAQIIAVVQQLLAESQAAYETSVASSLRAEGGARVLQELLTRIQPAAEDKKNESKISKITSGS